MSTLELCDQVGLPFGGLTSCQGADQQWLVSLIHVKETGINHRPYTSLLTCLLETDDFNLTFFYIGVITKNVMETSQNIIFAISVTFSAITSLSSCPGTAIYDEL